MVETSAYPPRLTCPKNDIFLFSRRKHVGTRRLVEDKLDKSDMVFPQP